MGMTTALRRRRGARRAAIATLVLALAATTAVAATAGGTRAVGGPVFKKVGGWGKLGTANGQFGNNAFGLATDKGGNVYVADTDNHRVQVFTASGGFVRKLTFDASEGVEDVAVSPDGTTWATSNQGARAQQFSRSGAPLESIGTTVTAHGVAVDADGNVLVSRNGDGTRAVTRYDKAAAYAPGLTLGGLAKWGDVEVSPDGSILVGDNGSLTVRRFDGDGKLLKTFKAGPAAPLGVGVDLDCNVWITNISQRRLDRFSPSGKLLGSVTSGDLIAQDVAVGPKGDLYAFDSGTRSVIRFAEDRSKPAAAAIGGAVVVSKGVAKVRYTLSGVACPAQVAATASLAGGVSGKAMVKVAAGRASVLSIPVKGSASSAQFKIVLKTNGRPTTQVATVKVSIR